VLKYDLPTMLLGGGGYTIENVSRLWTYETSIALGIDLDNNLPTRDRYYDYYKNDSKLHISPKANLENKNTL
jgi:histone deacetylase 1/2